MHRHVTRLAFCRARPACISVLSVLWSHLSPAQLCLLYHEPWVTCKMLQPVRTPITMHVLHVARGDCVHALLCYAMSALQQP